MTLLSKTTTIRIDTTPLELRKLADKMEEFWKHATIGDDLTVESWIYDDVKISFCIDQEKIRNDQKGK